MYGHTPAPPFLVVEDVVLLVLEPRSGRAAYSLKPQLLGGSLLVDLGLLGAVRADRAGMLRRRRVVPVGPPPADPLLANAFHRLDGRSLTPKEAGRRLGDGARDAVLERLATRGVVRRRETRSLGRRRSAWPSADTSRRDAVGHEMVSMLLHGASVPERSVALAAVLARAGLLLPVVPFPPGTRHDHVLPALHHHTSHWGFDLSEVMDACIDACSDGGDGGSDGGGSDGGGDGGGGDGGGGGGD